MVPQAFAKRPSRASSGVYHESVELATVGESAPREDYYLALEHGNVLFFPHSVSFFR